MNRIDKLFKEKKNNIFSVYFTAGFPNLDDTVPIIKKLAANGADLLEVGMPFSDPLADGPVIQQSSHVALENGMSLNLLFNQLKDIRKEVDTPLVMMGYINPVLQFGMEKFCEKCAQTGIDGVILPDLPLQEYIDDYKHIFETYNLHNIFLISPQTTEQRIRLIDENGSGFIYMVSSSSTTGVKKDIKEAQLEYFERIQQMNLKNPRVIGFGISDNNSFTKACKYANGAIIGSAFIRVLSGEGDLAGKISTFAKGILEPERPLQ